MNPSSSAILLTIGAVLLWRSGWVTRQLAKRRSKPPKLSEDFWTAYTPKRTGTSSSTIAMAEKCAGSCRRDALWRIWRGTEDPWALCDYHLNKSAIAINEGRYEVALIPSEENARS